ncbi:MAG TPA: benzoate/H(+) symporter BenE family transporter [Limnobacter sp.]|nr:benzoate/H(+) symporter BenE family transporter [Limnobacter sp.]
MLKDFSVSAVIAGWLAVFVGFAGPLAIVYQAAELAHLSSAQTASWIWAISIGSGVAGLWLSLRYKMPVITAWSTPGAALLIVSLPELGLSQAIGAYLVAACVVFILGMTGIFDTFIKKIPQGISAGLLAGVLLNFGLGVFNALPGNPWLVACMLLGFVACKRFAPRYAVAVAMVLGIAVALVFGQVDATGIRFELVTPVWTTPSFSMHAILSLALPLALVTLVGQHMPGLAVLKASGFEPPAKAMVSFTGLVSLLVAPFGAHAINPSVVAASICTGSESHEQPKRRYIAGLSAGVTYLVVGLFGGALPQLLLALPKTLIVTLAGLALIGSILGGLVGVVTNENHRDASVITFLVAASGFQFLGLSAAFWSLVIGGLAYFILRPAKPAGAKA